mmetsp:Transcript_46996/g.114215  ORF Transcript_46996/g.114215 Transcript_46996/m.114215 type:complete len:216 (-) Transcript_46996:179-826(-)
MLDDKTLRPFLVLGRRRDKPGEVDEVDRGHIRARDSENDDAVHGDPALVVSVLLAHDLLHLVPHVNGACLGRNDVGSLLSLLLALVVHLERGGLALCLIAESHMDGHSRADLVTSREYRHHCQPLKHAALAAALLPNHHKLRRLPAVEGRSQDVPQRIKHGKDFPEVVDARGASQKLHDVHAGSRVLDLGEECLHPARHHLVGHQRRAHVGACPG